MPLFRSGRDADTQLTDRLERWRRRRTPLALDVLPNVAPPGRRSPDLVIRWIWQDGPRIVLAGSSVVSLLRPRPLGTTSRERRELGPHLDLETDHVVHVERLGPDPGAVRRGSAVTVRLSQLPDPGPQAPPPATPPALEPLLGREVWLRVDGGSRVTHHGLLQQEGTSELPAPRGRLAAATTTDGQVVLVLEDGTVAVLHAPLDTATADDGTLRLTGDLGRIVLDLPSAEAHVARDATLEVRPLTTDPPA
jgi:hypothetical protein